MDAKINSTINVRDEKEFKLWIKIIASIYRNGGDIKNPSDILWRSFQKEIENIEISKRRSR